MLSHSVSPACSLKAHCSQMGNLVYTETAFIIISHYYFVLVVHSIPPYFNSVLPYSNSTLPTLIPSHSFHLVSIPSHSFHPTHSILSPFHPTHSIPLIPSCLHSIPLIPSCLHSIPLIPYCLHSIPLYSLCFNLPYPIFVSFFSFLIHF